MKRKFESILILLILVLVASACGGGGSDLTYKVLGTASQANIIYTNAKGETEETTVTLPWETKFGIGGSFDFKISVENADETGSITCEVWINERRAGGTSGVRRAECSGSFSGSKNSFSVDYRGRYDAEPEDAVVTLDEREASLATSVARKEARDATRTAAAAPTPTLRAEPQDEAATPLPAATVAPLPPITDFETYTHDLDCVAYNEDLKLRAFSVLYPSGSVIKDCSENAENYVQFEFDPDEDTEDAAFVMALGRLNFEPPDRNAYVSNANRFLALLASQMASQYQAEELELEPIAYQGDVVFHRDFSADIEGASRLLRLVAIPNYDHGRGLLFFAMQKIADPPEEAFPDFDELTRKIITSIAFAPVEPTIGPFTFATGVSQNSEPIDPGTTFPTGTLQVYGVFEYADIYPGMAFGFAWYLDGQVVYSDTVTWSDDSSSGRTWVNIDNDQGLTPGSYELQLFVNRESLQTGGFVIQSDTTPDTEAASWYDQGLQHYNQANYQEALAAFSQAIELDPEYTNAYHDRGVVYMALGDYEQAVVDLSRAIELDDTFSLAYSNRGRSFYRLGDYENALADLDQAIALNPDDAQAFYMRAEVHNAQGDLQNAIADYDQVIALDPSSAGAYINRGLAYANQGELDQALADYEQALALQPDNDIAYLNRGFVYASQGNEEQAIADFRKALELARNPTIRQAAEEQLRALGVEP